MKKSVKTVAVILAVIMMCGSLSGFAVNVGEKLDWGETTYGGEIQGYNSYIYEGKLTEGENTLVYNEAPCCREFYAEKDGYYSIEYNRNLISWIEVSERLEDGLPVDGREVFESESTEEQTLVYLEKGTHFISYRLTDDAETAAMKIGYQDIGIADLKFAEGTFDDLILMADVWVSEGSGETGYGMNIGATVVFTNGKEFELEYAKFILGTDGYLKNGENEVTVGIFDYTEKQTITVYDADYVIENIEIENLEKYLNTVEYYDGDLASDFENGLPETVTITFNDGTKAVLDGIVNWETRIEFPNGRRYGIYTEENTDRPNVEVMFDLFIADYRFEIAESKVRKATFAENAEKLEKYVKLQTERIKYYFGDFLEAIEGGRINSIEHLVSWIISLCRTTAEHGGYAVEEIKTFCNYYIG